MPKAKINEKTIKESNEEATKEASKETNVKQNYVRPLFAITILAILTVVFVAVFQRQDNSELIGKWKLDAIGGVKMTPAVGSADQEIDILENGSFSWAALTLTRKWKVDGANVILHPAKYDGKTAEEFRAVTEAKYPSNPTMQKIAGKLFEDLKLTIGPEYKDLSIDLGGTVETFVKEQSKQ